MLWVLKPKARVVKHNAWLEGGANGASTLRGCVALRCVWKEVVGAKASPLLQGVAYVAGNSVDIKVKAIGPVILD